MDRHSKYNLLKEEHFHRFCDKYNLKNNGYESVWELQDNGLKTLQIYLDNPVYPKSKKDIRNISKVYYSMSMSHYLQNDKDLIPQNGGYMVEIYQSSGDILMRGVVGDIPNPITINNINNMEVQ